MLEASNEVKLHSFILGAAKQWINPDSMEMGGLSSFKEPHRTVVTNQEPALDASTSDSPRSKSSLAISNRDLCFSLSKSPEVADQTGVAAPQGHPSPRFLNLSSPSFSVCVVLSCRHVCK